MFKLTYKIDRWVTHENFFKTFIFWWRYISTQIIYGIYKRWLDSLTSKEIDKFFSSDLSDTDDLVTVVFKKYVQSVSRLGRSCLKDIAIIICQTAEQWHVLDPFVPSGLFHLPPSLFPVLGVSGVLFFFFFFFFSFFSNRNSNKQTVKTLFGVWSRSTPFK